jgi:Restriction endonuclease
VTAGPADWRTRYASLCALPASGSRTAKQRRGKDFERVLHDMFAEAGMDPRSAYRPAGEEIDGSFLFHDRTMLFEAKWTSAPVPASALYQFRGKLEGKLAGTLGVFISMGGYAADAVDALIAGKSLNLVLFDKSDMDKLAQLHCIDIKRALGLKLRAAAENGTPYAPLPPCPAERRVGRASRLVLVVEGSGDATVIAALHQVYGSSSLDRVPPLPTIVVAGGLLNLPLVALAQSGLHPEARSVVIVVDGGNSPGEARQQIQKVLQDASVPPGTEIATLVMTPSLQAVLGIGRSRHNRDELVQLLARSDLQRRMTGSDELRQLLELLGLRFLRDPRLAP